MRWLPLILLGAVRHKGPVGELTVSAEVVSVTSMAIVEQAGGYLAEVSCAHAPGCDGTPVYAWSSKPAVFAFDGERLLPDEPRAMLAGGP